LIGCFFFSLHLPRRIVVHVRKSLLFLSLFLVVHYIPGQAIGRHPHFGNFDVSTSFTRKSPPIYLEVQSRSSPPPTRTPYYDVYIKLCWNYSAQTMETTEKKRQVNTRDTWTGTADAPKIFAYGHASVRPCVCSCVRACLGRLCRTCVSA